MNPARSYRQEGKRRKRQAAARKNALGSAVAPVAFARDEDSRIVLDLNPNRGKQHASKAGINLADDSRGERERVSQNQGRRKRGEIARAPYLETWNERIPALGRTLSKRVPRS